MIARQGVWREARVGAYIEDKNGKPWRITAFDRDELVVRIVDREGREAAVPPKPPTTPVVFLEPTEEEAFATIERVLGPTETMAVKDKTGIRCPSFPVSKKRRGAIETARAHLFLMHGIVKGVRPDGQLAACTDLRTFDQLVEAHNESHADEGPKHGFNNHYHDPSLYRD